MSNSRVSMDIRPGGAIVFNDLGIEVILVAKSGRQARLCVSAPRSVQVTRKDPDDCDVHGTKHEKMGTESR
jgi:sRNA-binding carbon storage regulator CsrA